MEQLPVDHIIEWDVENWGLLLKLWTPLVDSLPKGSKILAIGERNGGLSTWLALKGHFVWCTDRVYPTDEAMINHKKYGVSDNITYASFDVVHSDEKFYEQFDLVVAKSVIGGLKLVYSDRRTRNFGVQQRAIANIYQCLKPGGYFLSAENMSGGQPGRFIRRLSGKDIGWLHLEWKELYGLYGNFDIKQVKAFGILPGVFFKKKLLQKLSYFINYYILDFLPERYKYIVFVMARKVPQ